MTNYDATDESPAEELGRLRWELSGYHHDTPEYGMILNRIAVLVREAAERRRLVARAGEVTA